MNAIKEKNEIIKRLKKIQKDIKIPTNQEMGYIGRRLKRKSDHNKFIYITAKIGDIENQIGIFINELEELDPEKLIRESWIKEK